MMQRSRKREGLRVCRAAWLVGVSVREYRRTCPAKVADAGQDQITRLMPTSRLTFECDIRRRANEPWTSARLDRIERLEDARRVHAGHADYAWMAYVGHERDGAWYLLTAWQGTLRFEDADCPIGAHPADDVLLVDLPEEVFMSLGPQLAESWDYERISGLFASLPLT